MLEQLLIDHCAPTLAGLKTASLFRCLGAGEQELGERIARLNEDMALKGVILTEVKRGKEGTLVYVYRRKALETELQRPETQQFLAGYGYIQFDVDTCLKRLQERLAASADFPHEIGVFLGYPLEDVKEFIHNKGRNAKCIGCWKVYCNECEARKTFAKYEKCKSVYQRLFSGGRELLKLTVAA